MRTPRVELVPVRIRRPLPPKHIYKMNGLWKGWKAIGLLLGSLMALAGLTTLVLEMARAYSGIQNRGCQIRLVNGVSKRVPHYGYYPNSLLRVGLNEQGPDYDPFRQNYPPVNYYMWPWSRPAMLFGLVLLIAGLLGIISAFRRTYSIIMAFLAASLLSLFLMIYLISYYSVAIHYYNKNFTCNGMIGGDMYHKGRYFHNGKRLAAACLAFVIFGTLLSYLALILSSLALEVCRKKQTSLYPRPPPGPGYYPRYPPPTGFYPRPTTMR